MKPILFNFGPLTIYTYGVFVALGFLATFFFLCKEARKKNFFPDKILDLELVILVSGIIGARLLHVLVNLSVYSKNPIDIFFIWQGGLAFFGGLILAIFASLVFILKTRMPLLQTADFVAPYLALGHAVGRIGCFFNGCCFGKHSTMGFLSVTFPGDYTARFATQLYATIALFSIFVILMIVRKKAHFPGFIFGLYLLLYSTQRFFIDFLRDDTPRYFLNLTVSQFISIGLAVIVLVTFLSRKHGKTKS